MSESYRKLHRLQQQLRKKAEQTNTIYEEVYNPNRARLDLASRSKQEREMYMEQRKRINELENVTTTYQ